MLTGAIAGAEMATLDAGVEVQPGSNVAAGATCWRNHGAKTQGWAVASERSRWRSGG